MKATTDDFMRKVLSTSEGYCVVVLKATPNRSDSGAEEIVNEHVRWNMALREGGVLPIMLPNI